MMSDVQVRTGKRQQGGPPLGVLALVSALLLIAGLAVSVALGGAYPNPYGDSTAIREYFLTQSTAVKVSGVFAFGSSVPLALYAAAASARLRQLGVTAPGAMIALSGGVIAAVLLALSGLLQWTLARPEVREDQPLVRALHDLSFLTGGPAHVVFLGLLVAGVAVPALLLRLLPRPLALFGLVLAALAELCFLSLVWPGVSVLLPIARFAALVWLIVAGLWLPRHRPHVRADRPADPAVLAG